MEIDAKTVADLWETIKEYVPANKREELALAFLEVFVDHDIEIEDMEDLHGVDDNLDTALEEMFDQDIDEED
jgi:glycine cleavage system regulatory protein